MKKFLFLGFLFSIPFILLLIFFEITYKETGGDAVNVSLIPFDGNYRDVFKNEKKLENKVINISQLNLELKNNFDILSIGDSFSNQGARGFQNYLANKSNINIVHFDAWNYDINNYSPIQFLNNVVNGNLLDNLKVNYIFLEIVERDVVYHFNNLNPNETITIQELESYKNLRSNKKPKEVSYLNTVRLFYKNNLLYQFNDRAFTSSIHIVRLSKKVFSIDNNKLLYFYKDIENLNKAKHETLIKINDELNVLFKKLREKNITLIFMVCPDKYNMYSDYIINNKYPKSVFFENFKTLNKDYIYIDAKEVLKEQLDKNIKDLYFADDTHWSPKACKAMARNIDNVLNPSVLDVYGISH
jgi:hypothetical protein